VDRQRCGRDMEERGRRQCGGKLLRRRVRPELRERVECRGFRPRITVAEAALRRPVAVLRLALIREGRQREEQVRVVAAVRLAVRLPARGRLYRKG
jgi:hypothetical protein